MKKKRRRNLGNLSERPFNKHKDENPDKRNPDPDDPNEETGPPIKEMPIKNNPNHEEILD